MPAQRNCRYALTVTGRILIQILHDEISTLQLELSQIEDRNQTLTKDNAKLLQRWLDAKDAEANRMNEANQFYEEMRSRHQAVLSWRDDSNAVADENADTRSLAQNSMSVSGNGVAHGDRRSGQTKDGIKSPPELGTNLNPNG